MNRLAGVVLLWMPGVVVAQPALQVTRMEGELQVLSADRRPARLPQIAAGTEVSVTTGRVWFEAPVHAELAAAAGDRFVAREAQGLEPGVEIEAVGPGTRLSIHVGRADLVVRGGGIVELYAARGEGRFEVIRPPVEVAKAVLGPGEKIRVSVEGKGGLEAGDALFVRVPPGAGFAETPMAANRFRVHAEEGEEGAMLTVALAAPAEEAALARAEAPGRESDLRLAVAAKPGPAPGVPIAASQARPFPAASMPWPAAEEQAPRATSDAILFAGLTLAGCALLLIYRWSRRNR